MIARKRNETDVKTSVGRACIVDLDEVTFVDAFVNYQPTHV